MRQMKNPSNCSDGTGRLTTTATTTVDEFGGSLVISNSHYGSRRVRRPRPTCPIRGVSGRAGPPDPPRLRHNANCCLVIRSRRRSRQPGSAVARRLLMSSFTSDTGWLIDSRNRNQRAGCHPERSEAESKDLSRGTPMRFLTSFGMTKRETE